MSKSNNRINVTKLSDSYAKYLQNLIQKAGRVDKKYQVFGASKHKYYLNPPVTLEQVQRFEATYHIKFPDEYVFYMTKVSNGGPGPYYGLYSLEEMIKYNRMSLNHIGFYGNIYEQTITTDMSCEKWEEVVRKYEDIPDEDSKEFIRKLTSNMIVIGTQGCTFDHILLLAGEDANKVMYLDWNLEEDGPPYNVGMNFLEWMENYFQDIIDGHNMTSYGYRVIKTQKQVQEEYSKGLPLKEKKKLLDALCRYKKLEEESIHFIKKVAISDEEMTSMCVKMLLLFEPETGFAIFEELLAKNKIEIICQCVFAIPKDKREEYYEKILPVLYQVKTNIGESILFFLSDCSQLRAKDFIDFAEQIEDKELLKTAIYVLGQCPDALDYVDSFIRWMKSDEYWIAHTALQAMASKQHKKLENVYNWMENKYKKDSIMRNNLKVAKRTLQEGKHI